MVRFQTFMLPAMASRTLHLSPASIVTLRPRVPASLSGSLASPTASSATAAANARAPERPAPTLAQMARNSTLWLIILSLALGTLCFIQISNQILDVRTDIYRASAAVQGPFFAAEEGAPDGWNGLPGVYRNVPPGWECTPPRAPGSAAGGGAKSAREEEARAEDAELALPQQGKAPQEYRPPPKHSALGLIVYSPVYLMRATGRVARRLFTRLFGGK